MPSPWKNKKIFITGCTGLLGSSLTRRLVDEGASVVGLVRDWVPDSNLVLNRTVDRITTVRGEVEDYDLLARALNEYEIEVVFHLAAQTIVGTAHNGPLSTFETNIKGTWNILEAARQSKHLPKVLVASSDKAYGNQIKLPYVEDAPMQGRHPYDVSKSCADLLSLAYHKSYKLPVCVSRCGNFYGGGDLNFNRIVPGTILSILRNEAPVVRSDGKYVRDYIYVEDGVDAYLHLARAMDDPKLHGEAFNFSYEKPLSVLQVVGRISKMMKSNLKPRILNRAANEIFAQHLSSAKARKLLRWTPKFNLDRGLEQTIEWYRRYHERKS